MPTSNPTSKKTESTKDTSAKKTSGAQGAHTALYRKYRPADFNEVTGQSHIVDILREEVKKDKPNHAFLFAGGRGTGKTTIARIFAKNIGTAPEDIYEIDAASNTSVDDIRTLNDAIYTLPLSSKFKVYILDEVHMLSKSAFNAFLKTLEEPPKHVIFILATTELHKIPDTIISRCQVFQFKKPDLDTLAGIVTKVVQEEGYRFDTDSAGSEGEDKNPARTLAYYIAQSGRGSFRDLLTHIQKVLTVAHAHDNVITYEIIMNAIGLSAAREVERFGALFLMDTVSRQALNTDQEKIKLGEEKVQEGLKILSSIAESGTDMELFIDNVILHIRNEIFEKAQYRAAGMHALETLLGVKDYIDKTNIKTLPLELALYRFFSVK